ncbi:MAG: hypothetical protein IIA40_13070 [SAR324 cluster bacterium]|nr:hypothetical protein [SAR324 cluster bacterium]
MAPDKVARRLSAIVAVDAVRRAVEMQRIIAERKAISTDREVIWAM